MNWKKIDSDVVGIVPELMKVVTSLIPLLISLGVILILPVAVAIEALNFMSAGAYSWMGLLKIFFIVIALIYVERGFFRFLKILSQEREQKLKK